MGSHTAYEVEIGFLGVWQTAIHFCRNVNSSHKKIIWCNSPQTYASPHPFPTPDLGPWMFTPGQFLNSKNYLVKPWPPKTTYPPHSFKRSKISRTISKNQHPRFFLEEPYPNCQLWECNLSEAMNLQSLGLKSEDKERRWLVSIYSYRGCEMDVCILYMWGVGFSGVLCCSISWQVFLKVGCFICNSQQPDPPTCSKDATSYYLKNKIHSTLALVAENLGELATRRCLCICTAWKPRSPCWLLPSFVLLWPVISKANMSWEVMSLDLTPYVK